LSTAAYSPGRVLDKWLIKLDGPHVRCRTCGGHTQTAGTNTRSGKQNTLRPHITEERSVVLKRMYVPSVPTLRTLLVGLSFVAMALAGSAGVHWA
jgi:hypothetical protein